MNSPANLRIYSYIFDEGNVTVKGLGVKENEVVISEIKFEKESNTEEQKRALSVIRPEATLTEDGLKECLYLANSSPASLEKVANDVKTVLVSLTPEQR